MFFRSLLTVIFVFALIRCASADWFSDNWPEVRERIEQLTPKDHRADPMVLDCSSSDEPVSPSIILSPDVSFELSYPDERYLRACDPPEDPRYSIYYREGEIIVYSLYEQPPHSPGVVRSVLKEWIYTEEPNVPTGSKYSWNISGAQNVMKDDEGRVHVNSEKRSYIIDPVIYWTRDGEEHNADWQVGDGQRRGTKDERRERGEDISFLITSNDADYPLLIDPTVSYGQWLGGSNAGLPTIIRSMAYEPGNGEIYAGGSVAGGNALTDGILSYGDFDGSSEGFVIEIADGGTPSVAWRQWLGGNQADIVYSVAVTGDEIYAAGYSTSSTSFETVSFQGAAVSVEGFVIEIGDGGTPTLVWGQWIGGQNWDEILALAVTADEIYAAGYSIQSTSFEAVTFAGTISNSAGGSEGFVIEIGDGGTPTLVWGQWLGGVSADQVRALAVTADEIYAGGYSTQSTGWEAVTFQGAHVITEGFVIEIADGGTPTLVWGQWLGGNSWDVIHALAVTGDEIYAAGYSYQSTSWEAVTFQGAHVFTESFVVEIADGGTPTLVWGQRIGGTGTEEIFALSVTGDEIYAAGYTNQSTSFESVTFQGLHSGSFEGFVIEIGDGGTPTLVWGQWIGGDSTDVVYGLTVAGDTLYAGGYSFQSTSFESVTFQGDHDGGSEGFVIEIGDGGTPTLAWGQWLGEGGLVTSYDVIHAIAVEGNEIYAGGYSFISTSFESVTFQGAHSVGEGFVVEISDGGAPSLVWGQWLGGSSSDVVRAISVTGDEIYAAGESTTSTAWESVTFQGAWVQTEGFVVEIADGGTPSLVWGQRIGGDDVDVLYAMAVTGDEIYVAGYSVMSTGFETVTFQGAHVAIEGFVIEIGDGGTPTLVWGQRLGGVGTDYIYALAVTADEIYAGGYSSQSTSWESVTFQGVHSGGEGFVVEIGDGGTPTLVWGQRLGGLNEDAVNALAVNGDEIYAGGYATDTAGFEGIASFQEVMMEQEGFVVEILDGGTPSISWGVWLGSDDMDTVNAVAVTGDEIYVGGQANDNITELSFFSGTNSFSSDGFVVEIADGGTPTIVWGQWLGGDLDDSVYALGLVGDEIYAGGISGQSSTFESFSFYGNQDGTNEGFVIEITDDGAGGGGSTTEGAMFFGPLF